MTTTAIGQEAWRDLGGEPAALERIDASPVGLDSPLDVSGLLADSVGLASLAVQQIRLDHRQLPDATPIRVRGDRIATSARSERSRRRATSRSPAAPCPALPCNLAIPPSDFPQKKLPATRERSYSTRYRCREPMR